ncbi:hypothetical protein [Pseudorhodoplanes sinuspersici]|uniref:Uncharacterized protein n=1 Tax=Pseudorhodoplanes sinuspersici TaxID=1235591 RepID=A0A1W6ZY46_9HYPH|nr:hypothetical protein [Pseudorhodoplanes sinuspersici]ARQ02327.1 hypothetical protein CAK95_26905 [Pseudorhodoplanes sinuspersici]RKE74156.1 hypothetical protein DFP91_2058 [Pseudorhodoplanes sinuspersici]
MKIANCVLLSFFRDEILAIIDQLQRYRDRINIHILHNNSTRTDSLLPALEERLKIGHIESLTHFTSNIATAAFGAFFDAKLVELSLPYTIVSDGDIWADGDWLSEHINILEKHPDIFSVSSSLDESILKGRTISTYQRPTETALDHFVQKTGWCYKTMRTPEWVEFLRFREVSELLFHDNEVHQFASNILKKKSATAKRNIANHLRWGYKSDSAYNQQKAMLGNPWNHGHTSLFVFKTRTMIKPVAGMPIRRNVQFWRAVHVTNNTTRDVDDLLLSYRRIDHFAFHNSIGPIGKGQTITFHLYSPLDGHLAIDNLEYLQSIDFSSDPSINLGNPELVSVENLNAISSQ